VKLIDWSVSVRLSNILYWISLYAAILFILYWSYSLYKAWKTEKDKQSKWLWEMANLSIEARKFRYGTVEVAGFGYDHQGEHTPQRVTSFWFGRVAKRMAYRVVVKRSCGETFQFDIVYQPVFTLYQGFMHVEDNLALLFSEGEGSAGGYLILRADPQPKS
jgi:hypothetical protein